MDHAEVRDRLESAVLQLGGLAALDADPSDDAVRLRAHLASCGACADEARAWELAGAVLAANVPESLAAPAGARARTLATVAATGVRRAAAPTPNGMRQGAPSTPAPARPPTIRPRTTTPRPAFLAIAAALAAALFLSGAVLSGPLGLTPTAPPAAVPDTQAAAVASAVDRVLRQPDHLRIPLMDPAGTEAGSLLFDPDSRELVVLSQGLAAMPEGGEYGCYLERDGQRSRIGRLRVVGDAAFWMGPMTEPPDGGREGDRFVVVRDDAPDRPVLSGGF